MVHFCCAAQNRWGLLELFSKEASQLFCGIVNPIMMYQAKRQNAVMILSPIKSILATAMGMICNFEASATLEPFKRPACQEH